ncbi:PepSY domain-containing protein [Microvirga sp. HBU67558]|uniref:PepSY domain-containing protein n=1 Tax=Microvirga TaxID=186650 RepID=UPI001B39AEB4|nr:MULTISPECIES: PepSY domain-containing protein [unclassified Microvirga]MBQ0822273.1 PepSY domain-containing protein [Microvirga sp. HBU67558]
MRLVWVLIALWGMVGAASAQSAAAALKNCLPPREMQEAVAAKGVVAPASAVMTARRQIPGADVVRASLCRNSDDLVYVISVLQKDGRIVQVTIDGPSGRVKSVH